MAKLNPQPNKELTKLRRMLGLSKVELAAMLGVHRNTIRRWETGKTSTPYEAMKRLKKLTASLPSQEQG